MSGRELDVQASGRRSVVGKFEHLLGRSYATFKSDTNRLYVQWKPADEGELLRPDDFQARLHDLERRLAVVGIETYERVWVTRLDVSVDLLCAPEDGKALLDGLERPGSLAVNGLRSMGSHVRRCTSGREHRTMCSPRVLQETKDEERHTVREDPPGSGSVIQALRMVGGLLRGKGRGGDDLERSLRRDRSMAA